jgi:hypothetical protein
MGEKLFFSSCGWNHRVTRRDPASERIIRHHLRRDEHQLDHKEKVKKQKR